MLISCAGILLRTKKDFDLISKVFKAQLLAFCIAHAVMDQLESFLIFAFLLVCSASAATEFVALEYDQSLSYWQNDGWRIKHRVEPTKILQLTFAVKQRNTKTLERLLLEVSDPNSPIYGKYITVEEITNLVSPSRQALFVVTKWLSKHGVENCKGTMNKDFLVCEMRRDTAENLLTGSVFYYFQHDEYRKTVIRSPSRYYVPKPISKYLDFVGGLHRFPALKWLKTKVDDNGSKLKMKAEQLKRGRGSEEPKIHVGVYPAVLRERYNISDTVGSNANNSQVVAQFLEQYYNAGDLKEFMKLFGSGFKHLDTIAKVVGPDTGRSGIEASLDTQYIMSTGANIPTWFWSTAGRHETQEPFLTWMVAIGNMSQVPYVHSVSYGDVESSLSATYMQRVNVEFMKAGARGLTILFASGDDGAACKDNKFSPNFPVSSPYVTAVGGTALKNPFTISGEYGYEISGGGFSNVFKQPAYQTEKVQFYLTKMEKIPDEKYFNKTGRAYPDIAALSNHFWIVNNLIPVPGVAGTSAATPTVAGIISLLNDARLNRKMPVMGFINPFLYKNAGTLYDVTSGCNEGCLSGDKGFCAFQQWDPVTGNGTPNFPAMLQKAMG